MSSDEEGDFEEYIENVKNSARKSFARISANLEARELETLRQLDAIRKQCCESEELKRNCVRNLNISYENESKLLDSINCYGTIDFERLTFDVSLFSENRNNISNDSFGDHAYSLKSIGNPADDIKSRKEAVVRNRISGSSCKQNTNGEHTSDSSRKCSDAISPKQCTDNITDNANNCHINPHKQNTEDKLRTDLIIKKEPTDDWLESIKTETDAEPLGKDTMEHINISGS